MLATSFQLPDYVPIVSHFAKHAMWLVCFDILKIVNWKSTVSVEIHNNSSLSSGSRYCKPEVISWWKVNITVFYTRFLPPNDQKCVESSAFWQFFYYFPTSKFRYTARESVKMWCQEFDIYQYIYIYRYIDITLSISNMDFLCQFNLRLHHFWVFSHVKKMFFKSWQVCD